MDGRTDTKPGDRNECGVRSNLLRTVRERGAGEGVTVDFKHTHREGAESHAFHSEWLSQCSFLAGDPALSHTCMELHTLDITYFPPVRRVCFYTDCPLCWKGGK